MANLPRFAAGSQLNVDVRSERSENTYDPKSKFHKRLSENKNSLLLSSFIQFIQLFNTTHEHLSYKNIRRNLYWICRTSLHILVKQVHGYDGKYFTEKLIISLHHLYRMTKTVGGTIYTRQADRKGWNIWLLFIQ